MCISHKEHVIADQGVFPTGSDPSPPDIRPLHWTKDSNNDDDDNDCASDDDDDDTDGASDDDDDDSCDDDDGIDDDCILLNCHCHCTAIRWPVKLPALDKRGLLSKF